MEKIKVTNGVYWIDIPEENFYILCGTPADVVKHLMRRGLITSKKKRGVTYETGPNAILLCDVALQNGVFCNLAEFPILQMLYRQGLIVPNHPNNKGVKPLLIGVENQIKAQLEYIYRGNYGLISHEEIIASGSTESEARDIMRLKLKFAFGKFSTPDELLETKVINSGSVVKLRGKITILRKRLNVYEFNNGKTSMTVDLNLAAQQTYDPPYKLGFHKLNREYFSIIHSGEGNGWDIYRPCMASIVIFQGKIYLVDVGPTIVSSLLALGINVNEIEGVFHTHSHDDHFAGLTALVRSDHRIKYFATSLVRHSVAKKFSALMSIDEDQFSRYFQVCDIEFDHWNNINGMEVKPIFSPHPVETSILIFRARWENQYNTHALAGTTKHETLAKF
jgi:hemerythrin